MKVKELIELLKRADPEAYVYHLVGDTALGIMKELEPENVRTRGEGFSVLINAQTEQAENGSWSLPVAREKQK